MSKSESNLNRIFVDLEAAYIKKAKYVKIINTMKHSNIPYWKSIQMDHPIYSLKQAEYGVKRWENVYHAQIVKHINTYITNKKDALISLHALTRKNLIDLVANNLKMVQRARRHLIYVQKIYNDYKTRLEDINNKIKELKQEITTAIIHERQIYLNNGETYNTCTTGTTGTGEIEGLEQTINDTYTNLEYNNTPSNINNVIRANPEDCTLTLFNSTEDQTSYNTTGEGGLDPFAY